jgi:osmoprotectant transport system permease protein
VRPHLLLVMALLVGCAPSRPAETPVVRVGSKVFTEGVLLGEMIADLVRVAGVRAEHRETRGLGGTRVLWNALLKGGIDVYAEYTGTIGEEILSGSGVRGEEALRQALAERGVRMSRPLGFNNTYALGMRKDVAARLGVRSISDLKAHPELRFGFSNEFMDRADGWPGLRARYGLPQKDVRGLDHELAYRGLVAGGIDATDLYSTDATIRRYDLAVLADDLGYFPAYQAVLLYRADLPERAPAAVASFLRLEGAIREPDMIALNARVQIDKEKEEQVAADFIARHLAVAVEAQVETPLARFGRLTAQHLFLVGTSLLAAVAVAVPLGVLAARRPGFGQVALGAAGIIQTVPSIALLVFMIPLLNVGWPPAVAALFLYSLLPVLRNTYTGLHDLPPPLIESAEALGLPPAARLRLVELPLAARTIMAGIKTAAVINVGTATLGGFIGAGGYGELIFTGIRQGDNHTILQGAVPAALLALAVQGLFELVERAVVPKGLRLPAAG